MMGWSPQARTRRPGRVNFLAQGHKFMTQAPALETGMLGFPTGAVGIRWVSALCHLLGPVAPVCLPDWLLLQTPRLLFQEGEPIVLRCHSWKGWPLYKVTFFHNKTSRKFSHTDFIFSIPRANSSHSGKYHCTGFIRKSRHSSQAVSIAVRGRDRHWSGKLGPWKGGQGKDCWSISDFSTCVLLSGCL